ncbi:hypothetical protein SCLCIDRAFT_629476 [Scleroderma citrinum Foug A]|uniref:Uncharacterized protein n=1 Tax=Scleroderma citrinum Foug A TaxID=1036808 RepID=A0A0C3E7H9_9AGAM|nr:hypothetical protein SCLCIDRAFT_629476 [Scleroderma citrinum Foug A]
MFLENPEIGGTRLIQTIFHAIYTLLTHLVRRFIPLGYEPWVFERVQGLNCDSPGNNIASLTPSTLPCSLVPNQIQPYLSLSLLDFESHATISHYPRSTSDIIVVGSPTEHVCHVPGQRWPDRPPGEDRYFVWAVRMQNTFDYCGLLDIVEGKITKPSLGDAAEVIWKKINAAA